MTAPLKPFGLRISDDLKAWLVARANANGRSMNAEITQILKTQMAVEYAQKESA